MNKDSIWDDIKDILGIFIFIVIIAMFFTVDGCTITINEKQYKIGIKIGDKK